MGAESARRYNRDQAKQVADIFQRILDRISFKYTPMWLLEELHNGRQKAQCIQAEFERIMKGYGDEI